jgi:serine/threonine-protein kinase
MSNTVDFLGTVQRLRLVEPAHLAALMRELQGEKPEPRLLARKLIEAGRLTPYQANQLLQGHGPDLVLGPYVLLERLGEGGMGTVFKARHAKLGRLAALKVIRKDRLQSSDAVRRFQREVRAAAQLSHPHIVHAFDADEAGGQHFMAMEYVEGTDLSRLVKDKGRLPIEMACDYIRQAALGLQHAHERGLVHRDIKPSNLLLAKPRPGQTGRGPVVKVVDLGLARLQQGVGGEVSTALTESGAIMGTPDYMAPEQALQSHKVDIRADVYSLGCTLYFLLTGTTPFAGGTVAEKLVKHQMEEPVPVEQLRPEVPPGVAAVVRKLMAKKPEQRYQTPGELAEVLARAGEPVPSAPPTCITRERTPDLWARVVSPEDTLAPAVAAPPIGRKGRGTRWLLVGGAAFLAGLGLVGLLLARAVWSRPAEAKPDPNGPLVVRVAADLSWQDTGVDVVQGEAVTLSPQGLWRKAGMHLACGAEGWEALPHDRNVVPDAPFLCLLARIEDEPTPAPVLGKAPFTPRRSGRLYLQANDLDLGSNSGNLEVTIEGGRRNNGPLPPPGPTTVQAAEQDLQPLLARVEAPGSTPEQVREEVFAFCGKHAGTPQWARAAQLLRKVPLTNSIGMTLAAIPPGKFLMGSPASEPGRNLDEAQHEVVIVSPFYLGIHEVTFRQFKAFVEEKGYRTRAEKIDGAWRRFPDGTFKNDLQANWKNPGFEQVDDSPVVCVSWHDAGEFCAWLSAKEGKEYGLPTEAQWEYCCRAGSRTMFCFGDDQDGLTQYAWYAGNSAWETHPVGRKISNAWGLCDMHGNVWEWCQDLYGPYQKNGSKESGIPDKDKSDYHVVRGGSCNAWLAGCRSANRYSCYVDYRDSTVGFRVVRTIPSGGQ